MSPRAFLLPALAAGAAAWILAPSEARGFTTLGHSLDLTQRDFRVFDNFTDAAANDNQTPDTSFPGYQGAVLAIWKACVEWQSALHGSGAGDPVGGNLLGSGGANFDPSFQGLATGVGGVGDNIFSELQGSQPGVFSFTEFPPEGGWRIRFYSSPWIWKDGPGDEDTADIQGMATFQYGLALGLGFSTAPGSTMKSGGTSTGVPLRSIESDDQLGIQSIYGVKAPSKPTITNVSASSGLLTISGTGFAETGNTLWLTQAGAGGNGEPVQLAGIGSSHGGTQIVVAAPAAAGPGDVLVQADGTGHASLSNAWPVDPHGTAAGGIQVLGITPASIPVVAVDGLADITLSGTGFLDVTGVSVDGVPLASFPPAFAVLSDTELDILDWPPTGIGTASIVVTGTTGSDAITLDILPSAPPALELAGSVGQGFLFTATGLDITLGSDAGDLHFLAFSGSTVPSVLPGFVDFGIGNNFFGLFSLGSHAMPADGYVQLLFPVSGNLSGVTVHFQAAVVDVSTGLVFPLSMSNVQSGQFLL